MLPRDSPREPEASGAASDPRDEPRTSLAPPPDGRFGVRAEEQSRTAVLTAMLFVCSCIFVLGRTVRDALFLSHFGARAASMLPWMFVAYGTVSAVAAVGYARWSSRTPRPKFVSSLAGAIATMYLAAWALTRLGSDWLYATLYVASEIAANLLLAQFWAVANDLHDPRSAKRLFAVIGLGRTAGIVSCGLGAGSFVAAVGTDNLLLALAALSGSVLLFVRWLERDFGLGTTTPRARSETPAGFLELARSPYLRSVSLIVLIGFVAVNVGDFQFKAAARIAHPSRDELALFMARYYATMGVIAIVLQLFVTRPLLARFGVGGGLLALPVAYGCSNLLLLVAPGIFSATVLKLSDNAVQFTVFEATLQLLYFPLDSREREGSRAALEAAVKPLGYALAGLAVLLLSSVAPPVTMRAIAAQSYFVLPLVALWIIATRVVRRRYVSALERSLQRYREPSIEPSLDEATRRAALVRAAREAPARIACFAIEQLAAAAPTVVAAEAPRWLANGDPAVRVAALQALEQTEGEEAVPWIERAIEDEQEFVATRAVTAFAKTRGEQCIALLEQKLEDPRPAIVQSAVVGLLQHGALEGALIAGRTLEAWLRSEKIEDRRRAAAALSTAGVPGALRFVKTLLGDADVEVRRAAIRAAAASGTALAHEIMSALEDRSTRSAALEAAVRVGAPMVPLLATRLADSAAPRDVRMLLPRVLAHIGTRGAYEALLRQIEDEDEGVRQKVLASASRMRRALDLEPLVARRAEQRMSFELDAVQRSIARYQTMRLWFGMILLDRWMLERLRKGLLRVLRLAELSPSGGKRVEAARDVLFGRDAQRRARALEMLDDVLPRDVARRYAKTLDQWLALRDAPAMGEPREAHPDEMAAFVRDLFSMPDSFAKVLALDASQLRRIELAASSVEQALAHPEATVREFGVLHEVTFQREGWRQRIAPLADDEDRSVREYTRFVLATGQTGMSPEDEMFTTLEKVLFLHRIELFAEVAPEDLMALARSASVERRPKGTVLYRAGDPGASLLLVIEGEVQTTSTTGSVARFCEGEAFGELSALDGAARTDDAVVVRDATVLEINREDFAEVLRENGLLAEAVLRVVVRRMRALQTSMTRAQ